MFTGCCLFPLEQFGVGLQYLRRPVCPNNKGKYGWQSSDIK